MYGLRHFVIDNFRCREACPYLKFISLISAKIGAKNVARSVNKISTNFNAMNVAKYLQVPGDFSEQIVENFDCGNRLRSRKIGSANGSKFQKDDTTSSNHSIIQEMQIPKSSFLKTVNNLSASLPFRLYDIFNHLSTTPPIQQGLPAYLSFKTNTYSLMFM